MTFVNMGLRKLKDQELIQKTDVLVQNERHLLKEILQLFYEVDLRRLYSDYGFKSLFEMATKRWGYSEDAAYRRISAMRLLKELPELHGQVESGELNLTHLNLASSLFRKEAKKNEAKKLQGELEEGKVFGSQNLELSSSAILNQNFETSEKSILKSLSEDKSLLDPNADPSNSDSSKTQSSHLATHVHEVHDHRTTVYPLSSRETKIEFVKSLAHTSVREAERKVLALSSAPAKFKGDRVKSITPEINEYQFTASKELE